MMENDRLRKKLFLYILFVLFILICLPSVCAIPSSPVSAGGTVYAGDNLTFTGAGTSAWGWAYTLQPGSEVICSGSQAPAGKGGCILPYTGSGRTLLSFTYITTGGTQGQQQYTYNSGSRPVSAVSIFNFTPVSPFSGDTVYFTSFSTGIPTLYRWHYGNGDADMQGSTMTTTNKVYDVPGVYSASLYVSNSVGNSTTIHDVTVVSGAPNSAEFSVVIYFIVDNKYLDIHNEKYVSSKSVQ